MPMTKLTSNSNELQVSSDTADQAVIDAAIGQIKSSMQAKQLSISDLERLSGVKRPTLSRTLSGKNAPFYHTIAAIYKALGLHTAPAAPPVRPAADYEHVIAAVLAYPAQPDDSTRALAARVVFGLTIAGMISTRK